MELEAGQLQAELDRRINAQPDKWTIAWWNDKLTEVVRGYRGATHAVNCCMASCQERSDALEVVRQRCDALEAEREAANAVIGELRAELSEVHERQDKMAEYILKKFKENGGPK